MACRTSSGSSRKGRGHSRPRGPDPSGLPDAYANSGKIKDEYTLKNNALEKRTGEHTVTVGEQAANAFKPKATFEHESGAAVSIEYAGAQSSNSQQVRFEDEKIVWGHTKEKVRFYELPASNELPEGGYEIDVVFDEQPASNEVVFELDAEGVDFFYQPPLTDEPREAEIESCTDTQCVDANGAVVLERPEHVVGSYAVYYEDNKSGDYSAVGGENFRTGKAFHIYRPKISDAAGNTTWGTLSIDEEAGTLSVTVPQAFLDTATYPVIVDPTFGYGSVGASSGSTANAAGSKFTMPENGTITQISQYTKAAAGTISVGAAVYSDNAGAPNTLRTSHSSAPSQGTTASWVDVPVSGYGAATGTDLWLWGWGSASRTIYWDSGTTNQYNVQGLTWPTWTNPINPGTYFARKISIYASYTASSSNAAPTAPSSLLAEGQTNPSSISDNTPELSAIVNDPDAGDLATHYRIQVSTSSSFTGTVWDSGTSSMATTTAGNRSPDISYAGSALASSTTYYWRIAFSDDSGAVGAWSTGTSTFSLSAGGGGGGTSATFYTHSGDGYVRNGWLADTWANVRNATSGTLVASNTIGVHSGYATSGNQRVIMRGFLPFNTAALPDAASITSASVNVWVSSLSGTGTVLGLVLGTPASSTSLALGDFDAVGAIEGSNRVNATTTGWYTLTLNSTGLNWISKNGFTNFALRTSWDIDNVEPPAVFGGLYRGVWINSEESASTDPYMTVTYATGTETASVLQDITYTYDTVGNITKIVDNSSTTAARITNYLYDGLYRLLQASSTNLALSPLYTETYAYDALGNILSKSDQGTYAYSGSGYANPHALTSIATSGATTTLTYDNNGNLTQMGPATHAWLYSNRIGTSTVGSAVLTYAYDHTGERTFLGSPSATTTTANKHYELEDGEPSKSIYLGDELIATVRGTGAGASPHYVHTDHLGGTNVVSTNAGTLEQTLDYYPFGAPRVDYRATGFNETKKFTGHEYDADSGFYYMQARYQDPEVGRFASQDPVHLDVGSAAFAQRYGKSLAAHLSEPQRLNSYSYSLNNPVTMLDPDGEDGIYFWQTVNRASNQTNGRVGQMMNNQIKGYAGVVKGAGYATAAVVPAVLAPSPSTIGAAVNVGDALIKDVQDGSVDMTPQQYAGEAGFGAASGAVTAVQMSALKIAAISGGLQYAEDRFVSGNRGLIEPTAAAGASVLEKNVTQGLNSLGVNTARAAYVATSQVASKLVTAMVASGANKAKEMWNKMRGNRKQ